MNRKLTVFILTLLSVLSGCAANPPKTLESQLPSNADFGVVVLSVTARNTIDLDSYLDTTRLEFVTNGNVIKAVVRDRSLAGINKMSGDVTPNLSDTPGTLHEVMYVLYPVSPSWTEKSDLFKRRF